MLSKQTSLQETECSVSSIPLNKQMTFEMKTNSLNRQIEIKTKHEQQICTTKQTSPILTCSTIPNQSIQSIRISVHPSSKPNNLIKNSSNETQQQRFDHRPLRDLLNQSKQNDSSIVPPKEISPFQPVILHKKKQQPIDQFDLNKDECLFKTHERIQRSQTFSNTDDVIINENLSKISEENLSSFTNIDEKNETRRKAIAMQMYETEKSYVEALKNLVTKYYLPMKDKDIVSNDLINDIFYKIPEIHIHHTAFLISLSQKLTQWDNKQTIGDVLFQMFSRTSIMETYKSFVNNYKRAQLAINLCREYSSFNKFVEQQARDHRGKLSLNDLIIQPVQRIPRYELYIKDFLKCTNINHPDNQLLFKAHSEIHILAQQIDQVQKQVSDNDLDLNSNQTLDILQDLIENLNDLRNSNRYFLRFDILTIQFSSGVKKDRAIFLFNDLILITNSKRRSNSLNKTKTNYLILNSPCGKQYIENEKYKLIMKISLDNIDLATDHLKKRRSSISSLQKSSSNEKQKALQEDLILLSQISNLSKAITVSHQQLDDSIKDISDNINKQIVLSETNPMKRSSPELNSNSIQLILNTTDRIDLLFSSLENKVDWQKSFIQAKTNLFEIIQDENHPTFQQVLKLPHHRSGNEFTCGIIRSDTHHICLCNSEGDICLIDFQSNLTIKSFNSITSEQINTIEYIPSLKKSSKQTTNVELLFEIDSSDDDLEQENSLSFDQQQFHDQIWIGTKSGKLLIYECSQTKENFGRKNRLIKQFDSSIHFILYNDNRVYLGLNHRQICLLKRDSNGQWNFDQPFIETIEENLQNSSEQSSSNDSNKTTNNSITIICFVQDKLWCAIQEKIFVLCSNTFQIQHSFLVDEYHRHICSIATDNYSLSNVWIATQDSHQLRLYHSNHYNCLLEISIRQAIIQKLQECDDIIGAHKLGCLHISTLHLDKNILWIGTSAGIIVYLKMSRLTNKINRDLIQFQCLSYGHIGPVKYFFSKMNHLNSSYFISIGYGFEQFHSQIEEDNLGKDDTLFHLILWK